MSTRLCQLIAFAVASVVLAATQVLAAPIADNNAGTWTDFLNDSAGFEPFTGSPAPTDATYGVQFVASGGGYVTLPASSSTGHATSKVITPGPKSDWGNVYVNYTGVASTIAVTFVDTSTVDAGTFSGFAETPLGTIQSSNDPAWQGMVSLTGVASGLTEARLRFNFTTSGAGVKPTLGDYRLTWTPESEIRVGVSSPASVSAGATYAYSVQVAVSNVNATGLVTYVPMPTAAADPFAEPNQLIFVAATNGGLYTATALTFPGQSGTVTVPANSVYWNLGNVAQGTTTRMQFTVRSPTGTLAGTTYGAQTNPAAPPSIFGFAANAAGASANGNLTSVTSVVNLWTDKTTSGTYLLNNNHHARRGDTVTWRLQVANWRQPQSTGTQYYPAAQITDCPNADFLTAVGGFAGITIQNSSNGVAGSVVGNCIVWDVGNLDVGQTVTATYSAVIQDNLTTVDGNFVDNTVTLLSTAPGGTPGASATSSDTHRVYFGIPETPSGVYAKGVRIRGATGVSAQDDLVSTYVTYGEQLTWLLRASNTGASSLRDVLLVDRITDGTTFTSAFLPAGVAGAIYYHTAPSGTDDAPLSPPDVDVSTGVYAVSSTEWRVYDSNNPPNLADVTWILFDVNELGSSYSAFAESPAIPSAVTAEVTVTVDLPPAGTCPTPTLKDTASFSYTGYEPPLTETYTAVTPGSWATNMEPVQVVAVTPGFTLSTASASPGFLSQAGAVTFSVNVRNQAAGLAQTDTAAPVVVTIQVPTMNIAGAEVPMPYSGLQFVGGAPTSVSQSATTITVTYASMAGGASRNISFNASTLPGFLPPEGFTMSASIVGSDDVCGDFSRNVSASATIDASPWLVVQKSSNLSNVAPGAQYHYELSYTNAGPAASTGSFIVDRIPAGTSFVSTGVPAPGGSVWFASAAGKPGCTGLPSSLADGSFVWSEAVINACFVPADVPAPGTAVPPASVTTPVWVAFKVDHGTLTPPQLPVGTLATVSLTLSVDGTTPVDTLLRNNAAIFADDLLAAVSNDTIVIVGNEPSLALALSCPGVHAAGDTVALSLDYYNDSTTVADTASVVMNLPPDYTYVPGSTTHAWNDDSASLAGFIIGEPTVSGTSASGQTLTWDITAVTGDLGSLQGGTFTVAMTAGAISSGTLSQAGAIGYVTLEGSAAQLESSASCSTLVQNPDLCIDKSVFQPEPLPGETLTWYVVVNNIGLNDAQNVVVTDTLPNGFTYVPGSTVVETAGWSVAAPTVVGQQLTWNSIQPPAGAPLGYFGPSAELRFNFQATLASNTPAGTTLTNFVAVSTTTLEDDGCANTDLTPVTTPTPNVWVEKTAPATGIPGESSTFRLRYGNNSRAPAGTVVLIDDVPDLDGDGLADLTFTLPATLAPGASLWVHTAPNNVAAPAFNTANPAASGWTQSLPTAPARVNWVAVLHPNLGDDGDGPYSAFLTFSLIDPDTGLAVADAQTFENCASIALGNGDADSDAGDNADCASLQTPGLDLAAQAVCVPGGSIPGASIGDDISVELSATNPATRPVYGVTLSWTPPSGFSVLGSYNPAPVTLGAVGTSPPAVVDLNGDSWSGPLSWSQSGNTWYLGSLDPSDADFYRNLGLAPGSIATLTVYGVVASGLPNNFVITQVLDVEPDNRPTDGLDDPPEDILTNNTDSCNLTVYLPDPFVEKDGVSAAAAEPFTTGDVITYSLSFNNAGGTDAHDVVLHDDFPDGMGYVVGSITNVPDGATLTWICCDGATPCAPVGADGAVDTNICGVEFHWASMPAPANATTLFDTTAQFDTGGYENTISTSGSVYIRPELDATTGSWLSPVIPTASEGNVLEWIRLIVDATFNSDDATLSFDVLSADGSTVLASGLVADTAGGINLAGVIDAATVTAIRIRANFSGVKFGCDYTFDHATLIKGVVANPEAGWADGCTGPENYIFGTYYESSTDRNLPVVWEQTGGVYGPPIVLDTLDAIWGGEMYTAVSESRLAGELWGWDYSDIVSYWRDGSGNWQLDVLATEEDGASWEDADPETGRIFYKLYDDTTGIRTMRVATFDPATNQFYQTTLPNPPGVQNLYVLNPATRLDGAIRVQVYGPGISTFGYFELGPTGYTFVALPDPGVLWSNYYLRESEQGTAVIARSNAGTLVRWTFDGSTWSSDVTSPVASGNTYPVWVSDDGNHVLVVGLVGSGWQIYEAFWDSGSSTWATTQLDTLPAGQYWNGIPDGSPSGHIWGTYGNAEGFGYGRYDSATGTWAFSSTPLPPETSPWLSARQPYLDEGRLITQSGNTGAEPAMIHLPADLATDPWAFTKFMGVPTGGSNQFLYTASNWYSYPTEVFGCSVIAGEIDNVTPGSWEPAYWDTSTMTAATASIDGQILPGTETQQFTVRYDYLFGQFGNYIYGASYPESGNGVAFIGGVTDAGFQSWPLSNLGADLIDGESAVAAVHREGSWVAGMAPDNTGAEHPVYWRWNAATEMYDAPALLPQDPDPLKKRTIVTFQQWENTTVWRLEGLIPGHESDGATGGWVEVDTGTNATGFEWFPALPAVVALNLQKIDWVTSTALDSNGGLRILLFTATDADSNYGSFALVRDNTANGGYRVEILAAEGVKNVYANDIGYADVIAATGGPDVLVDGNPTVLALVFTLDGSGGWVGQTVNVYSDPATSTGTLDAAASIVARRPFADTGFPLVGGHLNSLFDEEAFVIQPTSSGAYSQAVFAAPPGETFTPFSTLVGPIIDAALNSNVLFRLSPPGQSGLESGFVIGAHGYDDGGDTLTLTAAMQVWDITAGAWQFVALPRESAAPGWIHAVGIAPDGSSPVVFGGEGNYCRPGYLCPIGEVNELVGWTFPDDLTTAVHVNLTPPGFSNLSYRPTPWTSSSNVDLSSTGSVTLAQGRTQNDDGWSVTRIIVMSALNDTIVPVPTSYLSVPSSGGKETVADAFYRLSSDYIVGGKSPDCLSDSCFSSGPPTPYLWGCSEVPGVALNALEAVYRTDADPSVSYDLAIQDVCQLTVTNNATISTVDVEITEANNSASTTFDVATANIAVELFADPGVVENGETITYSAEVTNAGPTAAENVVLNVSIPNGTATGFIAYVVNVGTVAAGQTVSFADTWTTTVATSDAGVNFLASAEVTTSSIECDATDNTGTALSLTGNFPNVYVQKSAPVLVHVGEAFTYTIVFGNNGNAEATNFTLADVIPAGLTILPGAVIPNDVPPSCTLTDHTLACADGTLPVGEWTITVPVVMNDCVAVNSAVTNTASVNADDDVNTSDNTSSVTTTFSAPAASVQLTTVASHGNVESGEELTFFVYYRNVGTGSVVAPTTVTATVPAGTTFVFADGGTESGGVITWPLPTDLAPGEAGSVAFTVLVTASAPASLTSIATFDAVSPLDSGACDVSATATTNVAAPGLHLVKQASTAMTCNGNVVWTLTASNTGAATATNVVVSDNVPAGVSLISGSVVGPNPNVGGATITWTIPSLAPGEAVSMGFTTTPPAGSGTMVANSASLTSGAGSMTTSPVVVTNDCNQAMSVSKAWDNLCAQPGDTISVTVSWTAQAALTGAVVTDYVQESFDATTVVVPPGVTFDPVTRLVTRSLGNIPASSGSFTWTATLASAVASGETYHNVATMSANGVEPAASNQVNGVVMDCDDGDVCTTDSCDPYVGCVNALTPNGSTELCDGIDNDCDGLTDANDVATSYGTPYPANGGLELEPCDLQAGVCEGSLTTPELCVGGVWLPCTVEIYEDFSGGTYNTIDDTCDGVDEDCSGVADEDYDPSTTTCGVGVCATTGLLECLNGVETDDCTPLLPTSSTDQLCNGLDDDCDGAVIDEETEFVSEEISCGENACAIGTGTTYCEGGAVLDTCSEVWSNISTLGDDSCLDAGPPQTGLVVIYLVVQGPDGQDAGSVRCWQNVASGEVSCDTESPGSSVLTVYPELLCLPPEGATP